MAIVNGFDTKKISAQLSRAPRYEIFYLGGDYYITDGVMLLRCGYDLIEQIQLTLGVMIPQGNEGWMYSVRNGWEKAPYKRLHNYLAICCEGYYSHGENKTMSVVKTECIKYGKQQTNTVVCTLENGEKVLLNKRYIDMMAASKKWGWFSEGKDRLDAIHFMNK